MENADDAAASVAAGIRALVGPIHASDSQRAHEDGQGAPTRPAVVVSARPRHSQRTPGEGTGLRGALAHAHPLRYRGSARLPRVVESSQHPLLRPTWLRRARADPVRRPGSGAHTDVARPSLTIDHRAPEPDSFGPGLRAQDARNNWDRDPADDDFLARVELFAEPRAGRSMAHRRTPRACGAQRRSALLEVAAAQIAGSVRDPP